SNSFVSCNSSSSGSRCISRTHRLQPAAEQAAHAQEPPQAASRTTRISCDPRRFRKDRISQRGGQSGATIARLKMTALLRERHMKTRIAAVVTALALSGHAVRTQAPQEPQHAPDAAPRGMITSILVPPAGSVVREELGFRSVNGLDLVGTREI